MTPIAPSSLPVLGLRFSETVPRQVVKARLESSTPTATTQTSKASNAGSQPEQAKMRQAALDFEAVFLRQMLSCLERTTKVSSKGGSVAGQGTYGSMIVDAVSEAVAKAGGLGLADVLAKAMAERLKAEGAPNQAESPPTAPGMKPPRMPSDSRPSILGAKLSEDVRKSPQGLPQVAVPRSEIRTSAIPFKGSLADRRIR